MSSVATNNWISDRLKDISTINLCSLPANTAGDFSFRYLEISNVNNFGVVSEGAIELLQFADAPSRARRVVRKFDVLISSVRPNLQAVAHADRMPEDPLVCSTGFNVVSPRFEKIADRFLYYFLLSEGSRQYFESVSKGVGYPAIDDKDFCSTAVPLPPLPEQKRIAAYLDASCAAIDRAVETKKKQLETLDALRKSIIQRAVTQGLNPDVKMTDSGVDWLGPIPAHWQVRRIKDIVDARSGNGITSLEITPVGEYPVYGGNGLRGYTESYTHDGVFVLIGRQGALCGNINYATGRFYASEHAVVCTPYHKIQTHWFGALLDAMDLNQYSNAAAQPGLSVARIKRLQIPVPPVSECLAIERYLSEMFEAIDKIRRNIFDQITTLTAYRKSLIHECVTGKRRISDADIAGRQTRLD